MSVMMMKPYDCSTYFDFTRIQDDEYVKEKCIRKYQKDKYVVLKYNKNSLNIDNIDSLGKFRSIIYNVETKKIVAYSPPKSYPLDYFTRKVDEEQKDEKEQFQQEGDKKQKNKQNDIQYEEYVEGTMINMFYDNDEWQIATRSIIGGKGVFFKGGKTFRQMFLECMNEIDIDFDDFNKDYSYSFVIQHMDNRIVTRIKTPKLVLCAIYNCEGTVIEEVDCSKLDIPSVITRPQTYDCSSVNHAKEQFASPTKTPYYIQGVIMKYNDMRTKMRNPNYEYVRQLRGNQPKSQYQYLSLRRQGLVREFLKYYPEYCDEFNRYRSQVHTFTKQLHMNYIGCYVKKVKPLGEYPKEYRQHMYVLHQKYIKDLIPEKKYVSYQFVVEYVNSMQSAHLMYAINYQLRSQFIDDAKDKKYDDEVEVEKES